MCFNMLSKDASTVGFIRNSSRTERVHQFQPTYKMSRADFHDLATIFAQLEAKDSGWEGTGSYLTDWRSSALGSCLTPEGLEVESEVTLYCVKQSVKCLFVTSL